jgi:hypothetical protein
MNLLEALTIVRDAALRGEPVIGDKAAKAVKIVNKKIASLQRKKAWRDCLSDSMPDHAIHPEHPLNFGKAK